MFTCRFYKVFGRCLLCCVRIGLDWIQILVHQLDWTGLGSVARGFGLDWIVSTRSIPYSGLNPLTYMGWSQAIPRQWRVLAADGSPPLTEEDREEAVCINYRGKTLALWLVSCHHLYELALPYNKPTAQTRWEQEGVDFGERWIRIYRLPFEVTTSNRLQSLQYRILHRYFPTRRFLYSRTVIDDPFCDDCGLVDSLYHYFFECHEVRSFCNELIHKINAKLSRGQVTLTRPGVIFGFFRNLR